VLQCDVLDPPLLPTYRTTMTSALRNEDYGGASEMALPDIYMVGSLNGICVYFTLPVPHALHQNRWPSSSVCDLPGAEASLSSLLPSNITSKYGDPSRFQA